jgi:hypothetical protein
MRSRQQIGRQACTLRSTQQTGALRGTLNRGGHAEQATDIGRQACTLRSTQQRKEFRSTQQTGALRGTQNTGGHAGQAADRQTGMHA